MQSAILERQQTEQASGYDPELERKLKRMTLIVGMVGTDGVVIAADQKGIDFALDDKGIDNSTHTHKVRGFDSVGLVCAYAGPASTAAIGVEISEMLKTGAFDIRYMQESLMAATMTAINKIFDAEKNVYTIRGSVLTVFIGDREPMLWQSDFRGERNAAMSASPVVTSWPITGTVVVGATGNSARYFDHYFNFGMPVRKLKRVAAQIILAGHEVDNYIDGLDVVSCSRNKIKWADKEEIATLRSMSRDIDTSIRSHLNTADQS